MRFPKIFGICGISLNDIEHFIRIFPTYQGNYPNYYKLCLDLLRPGGIIVFDNSLYADRVITDVTSVGAPGLSAL